MVGGWNLPNPIFNARDGILRGHAGVIRLKERLTKTQVDRLGDRLRKGSPGESDLRLLDQYRRTYGEAYKYVVRTIREQLGLAPTGRPAKSTSSLIEKLQRESIRLSQVQDIAGCRIVVSVVAEQEKVLSSLRNIFPKITVVDRRVKPSYGYRAVHVIVEISEKLIEIQVRSFLQHLWAEFSEKLSDVADPAIKYGGGAETFRKPLLDYSSILAHHEENEFRLQQLSKRSFDGQVKEELTKLQKDMDQHKDQMAETLTAAISRLESKTGH